MHTIGSSLSVLAIALGLALHAPPSQAQFNTFVRGDGSDMATCVDFANACQTVGIALVRVLSGGIVQVIEGGSFAQAAWDIDKPVTVLGLASNNLVTRAGTGNPQSGIWVHPPSANDIVMLRGFTVDHGNGGQYFGLSLTTRGTLHLEDCLIRGSGTGFGISFTPNGPSELHISNCTIADNGTGGGGGGIIIRPTGSGSANVVLEDVHIENNRIGLTLDSTLTTGAVVVTMRNVTVSGGSLLGVLSNGPRSVLRIGNSTISANPTGIAVAGGGQIISIGGNIVLNNAVNGTFTSTVAQQ